MAEASLRAAENNARYMHNLLEQNPSLKNDPEIQRMMAEADAAVKEAREEVDKARRR